LVYDVFFEAGVGTEFFNGDELVILLIEVGLYFSEQCTSIAITSSCDPLNVFGVYCHTIHSPPSFPAERNLFFALAGRNGRRWIILSYAENIYSGKLIEVRCM